MAANDGGQQGLAVTADRPLLLWDMNGVLLSRSRRKDGGVSIKVRPGVQRIPSLSSRFRLGVFTSMTHRSLTTALAALRDAGLDTDAFEVLLDNGYCQADYNSRHACFKPLNGLVRGRLDRVILVDDDPDKAYPGEEDNMIAMSTWKPAHGDDGLLAHLCDTLLRTDPEEEDARVLAAQVTHALDVRCFRGDSGEDECTTLDVTATDARPGVQSMCS